MSITASLTAAHAAMCTAKGGTLTFSGASGVAAFQSAATLAAIITSGGQTATIVLTLTALRSAFATIPKRGTTATYVDNATSTSRALALESTLESDAYYTFSFVDPRT